MAAHKPLSSADRKPGDQGQQGPVTSTNTTAVQPVRGLQACGVCRNVRRVFKDHSARQCPFKTRKQRNRTRQRMNPGTSRRERDQRRNKERHAAQSEKEETNDQLQPLHLLPIRAKQPEGSLGEDANDVPHESQDEDNGRVDVGAREEEYKQGVEMAKNYKEQQYQEV
ncbi:uncharacterized protein BDZ99DRAFT_482750 [Mytilinidion resinicola]|uniref:Zinc knuckle domain-containing protein n=1 Tax=Mytilinidion resinicola TaxID=574789 RepID=A0A6A6Y1C5_9PEZI|nr:uncharacterized protein BDZ99DRAFT_482750 [Mytilinidion resinicola]KAF2802616.1 hypothetical protein BDZ99DRAFT_482750 [Mytilinidion resinicola]